MRAILTGAVLGLGLVAAGSAGADPVDATAAREMLFAPKGMTFYPVEPEGLDADATAKVAALQQGMEAQMAAFEAGGYGYYGAFAVPKGQPLSPQSLVVVAGLHSPGAAQMAVLEQCKDTHKADCVLIGLTLPEGYKKQPLMLSAAAAAGVEGSFGDGGPRYLAYSPSTAGFAVAKGPGADAAAVTACNEATGGRDDCVIGVIEE